ncbi:HlyD family efflux transporter periplasmic adaptor subunit [Pelagicoccus sp. SDUM812003]|uniref:HlyD family secretion protein n=1 Tax=Pelagicoccus sp. SDUM812003 TaxID=3041267 RepID=UPI00280FBF85|nr:HlyD family efflux transporter periplasmic adaptor subunit [Pelagicoccus sp. SDUM812003]MDQ8202743.1 efflux RND transporter periplasmic adaptor subunit [Pelagicoccus sp. SDUM812003]
MDIVRKDLKQKKRRKQIISAGIAVVAIAAGAWWLSTLDVSTPTVEHDRVWLGHVEQGEMMREARGIGTLVPEDFRWIASETSGRVEQIIVRPGAWVEPDTAIMILSNPTLEQQALDAKLAYEAAQADYVTYDVQLQNNILQLRSNLAQLEAQQKEAALDAEIDTELNKEGLVSDLQMRRSLLRHEQLTTRLDIERQRLEFSERNLDTQLSARKAQVNQAKARFDLLRDQFEGLTVVAGVAGVLQKQTVEEGMQVGIGQNLSQVADPKNLKAVVRIAEINAKDLSIGLPAVVDTRNGKVRGAISRVDPNVENGTVAVDIRFTERLPEGARPDLTVEGVVEFERLANVIKVKRPASSRPDAQMTIFKLQPESDFALRVPVVYGKASVNQIEVVEGLQPGDEVVLNDMSEWDTHDKIRIQ